VRGILCVLIGKRAFASRALWIWLCFFWMIATLATSKNWQKEREKHYYLPITTSHRPLVLGMPRLWGFCPTQQDSFLPSFQVIFKVSNVAGFRSWFGSGYWLPHSYKFQGGFEAKKIIRTALSPDSHKVSIPEQVGLLASVNGCLLRNEVAIKAIHQNPLKENNTASDTMHNDAHSVRFFKNLEKQFSCGYTNVNEKI